MAAKPKPQGQNDPTDFDKFEREISKEVNKREAPTYIEGKPLSANLEDRSYFDVYQLDFGRLDDEPPLVIVGNDAQIALQASVLRAVDQLLTIRGLGPFKFQVWAKEFENGFGEFEGSPELKKMRTKQVWPGVNKENRPKIVELPPSNQLKSGKVTSKPGEVKSDWDFRVIQFFPNRKDKNYWIIFTGSYREIAQQIINWWNQKEGGGTVGAAPRLTSDISQLSKHPYIDLFFKEEPSSGRGSTQLVSEISFRLMDKIEYEGLLPNSSILTIGDIKQYAKSIERIFASSDKPYVIRRGRGSYTYNDWPLGYKLWLLANSAADAEKVFKDILKIQGHTFNELHMGIGAARNPAKKYPIVEPQKNVLNEKKSLPNQRQTGEITFRWAKLCLPMTKDSLILASRERRMRIDERLQ